MKKIVGYLFKCILAGIISVIILSSFSLIYYNPPIATPQPDFITNNKFVPDLRWSFMLEGFGFGKTDQTGYNSAYYDNCTEPDVIFIGSSHMEALQVPQEKNCVYLLNEMLDKDELQYNNLKCLNLGVSGHFFEATASNYKYIAEKFKGTKYAVIEVFDTRFPSSKLDEIIEGKFHTPLEKKGVIYETAQRIPFFRLMYKKINEAKSAKVDTAVADDGNVSPSEEEWDMEIYTEKMNTILSEISSLSEQNGIKPIILMHERFWEDKDRNIVTEMDKEYKKAFTECCALNGMDVIDVTPSMIEEYNENYAVSYGFANTTPGEGHLNKTGHRIIAETVYKYINEKEENK